MLQSGHTAADSTKKVLSSLSWKVISAHGKAAHLSVKGEEAVFLSNNCTQYDLDGEKWDRRFGLSQGGVSGLNC